MPSETPEEFEAYAYIGFDETGKHLGVLGFKQAFTHLGIVPVVVRSGQRDFLDSPDVRDQMVLQAQQSMIPIFKVRLTLAEVLEVIE